MITLPTSSPPAAAGRGASGAAPPRSLRGHDIYSFEALWRCYRSCRRRKRTTAKALRFELEAEAGLLAVQTELREHTCRPGRSICFVCDGPKPREVFAADFRDRIVHHLLVSHQEPVFEPGFIHDSFACRKGKGTLAALGERLRRFEAAALRPAERGTALQIDLGAPAVPGPRGDPAGILAGTTGPTAAEALHAALVSYAGHLRHGAAKARWEEIWAARPWLDVVFERRGFALRERFVRRRIERAQGFRRRYWETVRRAGEGCVVFFRVGSFVELRGPQRLLAERALGLRPAPIRRGGFLYACGFPHRLCAPMRDRALAAGLAVLELERRMPAGRLVVTWTRPGRATAPGVAAAGRPPEPCPGAS